MLLQGLFVSLGIGYALCVLAKKETGVLRTLGYTLGISIIVLSLAYGLLMSEGKGKMGICCPMMKMHGGMMHKMGPRMK